MVVWFPATQTLSECRALCRPSRVRLRSSSLNSGQIGEEVRRGSADVGRIWASFGPISGTLDRHDGCWTTLGPESSEFGQFWVDFDRDPWGPVSIRRIFWGLPISASFQDPLLGVSRGAARADLYRMSMVCHRPRPARRSVSRNLARKRALRIPRPRLLASCRSFLRGLASLFASSPLGVWRSAASDQGTAMQYV